MATAVVVPEGKSETELFSELNPDLQSGTQSVPFDLKFMGISVESATSITGETTTINLWEYGITRFLGIKGWVHTTSDSVVVAENPTTAVDDGVLTITFGGTNSKGKRFYIICGV